MAVGLIEDSPLWKQDVPNPSILPVEPDLFSYLNDQLWVSARPSQKMWHFDIFRLAAACSSQGGQPGELVQEPGKLFGRCGKEDACRNEVAAFNEASTKRSFSLKLQDLFLLNTLKMPKYLVLSI